MGLSLDRLSFCFNLTSSIHFNYRQAKFDDIDLGHISRADVPSLCPFSSSSDSHVSLPSAPKSKRASGEGSKTSHPTKLKKKNKSDGSISVPQTPKSGGMPRSNSIPSKDSHFS